MNITHTMQPFAAEYSAPAVLVFAISAERTLLQNSDTNRIDPTPEDDYGLVL